MPDTFSAKQVATRIGTDAKTLRKFLRSAASPYDAVGQGGRYEFPKDELATIKKAFLKWQNNKRPTTVPVNGANTKKLEQKSDPDSARRTREMNTNQDPGEDPWGPFIGDADIEPTEEDLAALEDLDLEID